MQSSNSVMTVTLHKKQRVSVSSYIHFQHLADSGKEYELVLNWRQFLNLNDYICNYKTYSYISYYPLGDSIWLYHKDTVTDLINYRKKCFFSFYEEAWEKYRYDIHFRIYDSFKHGKPDDYQPNANHDRQMRYLIRRHKSFISRHHKTLPRTARDVTHENEQRTEHANVSERKSSNSRSRFQRRSRKYASRIYREIKAAQDDYNDGSSNGDDNIEHGNECTIDEESVSEQDPLE